MNEYCIQRQRVASGEKIGGLVCGGIMKLITDNTWDCTHKIEKRVTRKDCKESDRHNQTQNQTAG